MSEPTWKRLVADLRKKGHESPYLDRLEGKLPVRGGDALRELEAELVREMASALGRADDKVNAALLELELVGQQIDRLEGAPSRDARAIERALLEHARLRSAAEKALWELRVHREALGFRRHDRLAELYPVPPPRRARG